MRNAILYIFSLIVSFAVGIAAYGSYLSHDYSMSTKPEPTIQYVYIEREPEVITETVYIEVEPTFYRSLTEDDCYYLMDIAMRESENQGVVGMLWVMYTAECRAEAYGLTYEEVWKSDAFSSSWNRRGIEPNEDCKEAIALFEEGWLPKPLYFRAGHYHSFGTELCQVGNHFFSTR